MGFSPQSARCTAYGSGRHTGHHHQPASQLSSFLRKKLFRVSKQSTRPPPSSTLLPHELVPSIPPVPQAGPAPPTGPISTRSPPVFYRSKGKMLLTKQQGRHDPVVPPLGPAPQSKPQHTASFLSKEDQINPDAQTAQQERCASQLLQDRPDEGNETQRDEPRDALVHLKLQRQHEGGGRGAEKEGAKGATKKHSSKTVVATLATEQEEKVREFKEAVRFYKHQLECGYRHHILTLDQMKSATEVLPEEQRAKALQRYAEAYAEVLSEHLRARRTPAALEQYEFIQTLGHGGFGAVYLVRKRTDGQYFALKQVPKKKVLKASSRERQLAERNFLSVSRCPSIVQLHATFQDELFLYQVGEFLQGGSLMHYMHAKQKFPEDVVKVCIAELVLAVKEVHDRGYIHRDIKPDNIVFTRDGHLKLLDFGLAKFAPLVFQHSSHESLPCVSQQCCSHIQRQREAGGGTTTTSSTAESPSPIDTGGCSACARGWEITREVGDSDTLSRPSDTLLKSICGTPMYTAPEVLRGEGYENSVDWWSVGVVMFEMLYGGIPFCPPPKYRGDVATFVKVQVTNHALVCPIPYPSPISSVLSPESVNFMQSMVCEPQQRLKTAASIIRHPWFADIEWHAVHRMRSPLREDTEQYAQKHFAHLTLGSPSSSTGAVKASPTATANVSGKHFGPASGNPIRRLKLAAPAGRQEQFPTGSRVAPPPGAAASHHAGRPAESSSGCASSCSYAVTEHDLFFSRYAFSRKAVDTVPTFSKVLQRTAEKYPIFPPPLCLTTSFSTASRDPNNNTISTSTPPLTDSLQSFNCTSSGFCPSSRCSCECSPPPSTSSSSSCGADCCNRLSKRSPPLLRETERLIPAVSEDTTLPASGEAATTAPGIQSKAVRADSVRAGAGAAVVPCMTAPESLKIVGLDSYARGVPPAEGITAALPRAASARENPPVESQEMESHAPRALPGTGTVVRAVLVRASEEGVAQDAAALKADPGKHESIEIEKGAQDGQPTAALHASESHFKTRCTPSQPTKGFAELPGAEAQAQAIPDQIPIEVKAVSGRKNCRTEATSCLPSPAPSTRASCGSPQAAHSFAQKPTHIKQALEKHLLLQHHEPIAERLPRQNGHTREKQTTSANETTLEEHGLAKNEYAGEAHTLVLSGARNARVDADNTCLQCSQLPPQSHELQDKSTFHQTEQHALQQKHQVLPPSASHRLEDINALPLSEQPKLTTRCEDVLQNVFPSRQQGPRVMQRTGPLPLSRGDPPAHSEILQQECERQTHTFESASLQAPPALTEAAPVVAENGAGILLLDLFTTPVTRTVTGNMQNPSNSCLNTTAAARIKDAHKYSKEVGFPTVIISGGTAVCPASGNEARAC